MTSALILKFQYDSLAADHANALRGTAVRIRQRATATTAAIIEIGRDLITVKKQLKHGAFTQWVTIECGFTARTAQNYMLAAELAAKYETVALLPPATLYRLAGKTTPPEIIDQVLERLETGTPPSENEVNVWFDQIRQRRSVKPTRSKCKTTSVHQDDSIAILVGKIDGFFAGPDGCRDNLEKLVEARDEIHPCKRLSLILALREMARTAAGMADELQPEAEVIDRADSAKAKSPTLQRPLGGHPSLSPELNVMTEPVSNTKPASSRPTEAKREPIDYTLDSPGPKHGMPDFLRTENRGKPPSQWGVSC